ncbi:PadR family transcriptional regulator [Streptomyces sp. NPDC001678]|uniref:PadR family transcriptional regulator n=1 Tax=Streptomyces sp. NPDC001678 TaxID=3364599 RepID=UPI0036CCCC2C
MSATRLLVLGVVRGFGRTHGYQVRSELLSWGVEGWANVKWGSIYHALRQLAKEGLLEATEIEEWPGRVDYQLTEEGDEAFFRLLLDALKRPEHRPDTLGAGLALMPALSREQAIGALRERLATLEEERDALRAEPGSARRGALFGHLSELRRLRTQAVEGSVEWTRDLLDRLAAGEYVMAGEDDQAFGMPGTWPEKGSDPAA